MRSNRGGFRGMGLRFGAVLAVVVSVAVAAGPTEAQDARTPTRAQDGVTVFYSVGFPNAEHHEAEVRLQLFDLDPGTVELRMSRTSPGRYAVHEFAKNVYNVRISGAEGTDVVVERPDPHQWNVSGHGGQVTVEYTLFGDRADGTYAQIDETHAHLNMPASFMWARGLEERPIWIRFFPPEGSNWRVATQLAPTPDPNRFAAPGLAYFLDSPTILADDTRREFTVPGPEGEQTVRVSLQHLGTEADADRYAEGVEAIVREAGALFGEYPRFDYGEYTFLAAYLPWASGDGMEHRNSTILTSTGTVADNVVGLWGTVAHEFIHAWNVERIRPADLEPFDFEDADMSQSLWFAEGFTSYLDDLLLVRGGLISRQDFAARMGGAVNFVTNAPGRGYASPVEMSMRAPFTDRASSADPLNQRNIFISYYTWGSVVGLGLDLELKARGLEIDGYMQAAWSTHGVREIPYEVSDLEAVLAEYTGDPAFARDFFERYVHGREVPDFERLFAANGLQLERTSEGAWIGNPQLRFAEDGATVQGVTLVGSPLYEAGVDRTDRITHLDGRSLRSRADWDRAVESLAPGRTVEVRFVSRGREFSRQMTPVPDPSVRGSLADSPTAEQSAALDRWLSPRAGG